MFPPPWDHDPSFPALSSLFGPRGRHRPNVSLSPCLEPYDKTAKRRSKSSYDDVFKSPRFTELDTPSSSSICSDWDDPYALDTDPSIFSKRSASPFSQPRRRLSTRAFAHTPDLHRVSLTLPSASAAGLRSDDVLILPPLVHLQIRITTPHTRPMELRAAVPGAMAFGDMVKHVLHAYVGDGVRGGDVRARVEQRGRMKEAAPSTAMEDLAHRGEVLREGRMEMRVDIVVGDEELVPVRGRYGGRGPWGGAADVEMVRQREVSRTRVAHV